jgi:outer membrane protein assembly factor BamB
MPTPLLVAMALGVSADVIPPANSWPQWRGPARDGHVPASAPEWPNHLNDTTFKKVWSVDALDPSYSGPIISSDKVFTTETVDKKREVVTAFDRKTGKKVWDAKWDGAMEVPFFAAKNGSWIRSTPVFDGDRLFVAGMRDVLVCLNGSDGKELWRYDFVKEQKSPFPDFGFVCSPLVDDSSVYVQAGGGLAKLDKKSGKLLWHVLKDGGGTMGSAFSCPVFAKLGEKDQLVVQTRTALFGVDSSTGQELWKRPIPSFRGMNILTPVVFGDTVFTSTYGGNSQGFTVRASGDGLKVGDGWAVKYEGHMTTPVVVDGHAYFLGKDRRAVCMDLKAGKETWRSEKAFSDYWSLVANKGKILALDSKGKLLLLRANPKQFEVLAERVVSKNETWAHLAVSGEEVVIRDLHGLTMYHWAGE